AQRFMKFAIWFSGVAAFAPLGLMAIGFQVGPFLTAYAFGIYASSGLMATALIVLSYVVYAIVTPSMPVVKKLFWVPVLVFGNILATPIFWFQYIWRPSPMRRPRNTDKRAARPMLMTVGMVGAGLWAAASMTGLILHPLYRGDRKLELPNQPGHDVWWI